MRNTILMLSAWLFASTVSLTETHAKSCTARSGPNKVALVELYTSEGCSSCPPADSWLSALPKQNFADKKLIPLSFHVDYWDYLGWSDRFARKRHTSRQRKVASVNRLNTIYTPQVVVNGRDFRYWSWGGRIESSVKKITSMPAQAKIDLTLKKEGATKLMATSNVMLLPQPYPQQSSIFMALYHNKQSSRVRAGENSGRELRHDFVVRELKGPFEISGDSAKVVQQDFYLDKSWNPADIGIAVFVQDQHNGEILQALASHNCT